MATYQSVFKRCEKKYLITQEQYDQLSAVLRPRVGRDEFAESTISNIYYDTPTFQLIRASLAKPAYKEKLRLRTYHTPSADTEAFVEIKKKFDHVVYKRRIGMSYSQAIAYLASGVAPQESQISHEIDWFLRFYQGLRPAMCICYDRLAVFDREQPELRITFDTNIRWRMDQLDLAAGPHGEQLIPPDHCLMEIKIPGATPLWLAHTLSEIGIFSTSFSKYGTAFQTLLQRRLPVRQSRSVFDIAPARSRTAAATSSLAATQPDFSSAQPGIASAQRSAISVPSAMPSAVPSPSAQPVAPTAGGIYCG